MPDHNNQAFSNARKERHSKSGELISELLVQLDTLDLQAQFQSVELNTEGNFRKGGYLKFVFDNTEGQGDGHQEHDQEAAPLSPIWIHPPEGLRNVLPRLLTGPRRTHTAGQRPARRGFHFPAGMGRR